MFWHGVPGTAQQWPALPPVVPQVPLQQSPSALQPPFAAAPQRPSPQVAKPSPQLMAHCCCASQNAAPLMAVGHWTQASPQLLPSTGTQWSPHLWLPALHVTWHCVPSQTASVYWSLGHWTQVSPQKSGSWLK
jgi:hypothetical protein